MLHNVTKALDMLRGKRSCGVSVKGMEKVEVNDNRCECDIIEVRETN